ncbi:MAG TPA: DMT family transporter [Terrimesophilobacter sp.]|mgnify:CR=1 FL=1|nr:DMT family transporter [Terrimesophilobacter sp.]HRQ00897.1 DMT family transporter [Terrimesophilobacter sp.]
MRRSSTLTGLAIAVVAALAFGMSGPFIKPLLEAGWSPAAGVTVRSLVGGIILAPIALYSLRGKWHTLWAARTRILLIGLIGVAATQLAYFVAIALIPVSTGILIEFMAPLLLVGYVWARTRKTPKMVVFIGSILAIGGLFLVVSPGGGGGLNPLGLLFAALAAVGCAIYFVAAADDSNRGEEAPPAVAVASVSLLIGGGALGLLSLTGLVPFTVTFGTITLFGNDTPWWVPIAIVAVIATGFSYAVSITASQMLGARLASFAGLLEVVASTLYAWILLGEQMTLLQLFGGALILVGIGFVRSEKVDEHVVHPEPEVPTATSEVPIPA